MQNEIWVPIKGFELTYEVSNFGRVKSLDRKSTGKLLSEKFIKGKILTNYIDSGGYPRVDLGKIGATKRFRFLVHRLVADAFIPIIENKFFINHIDGCKSNAAAINLEWCTASENGIHAHRTELTEYKGKFKSKITCDLATGIFYFAAKDVADSLGMNFFTFKSRVRNNKAGFSDRFVST